MQPGQTSGSSSSFGSSNSSSASYSDNVIQNMRRRFELLTVETPELDFATRENLAKSSLSDDSLVQTARSSVSFAARELTVQDLKSKSNKEQRAAWEKMSESRRQFLVDAGYTVPDKKKAQWVSWWEYPQHYVAEYVAKGWDYSGADTAWRATGGKPTGWFVENVVSPVFGAVANFSDDVAGRTIRAAYDSLGQNELARWQIGMQHARAEYKKQNGDLTDEQWQYVLWRYTNENLGELNFLGSSNTDVPMLAQAAKLLPPTNVPLNVLEILSAIPGLGFLENTPYIEETQMQTRKVNPFRTPPSGVSVDDATYEKFSSIASTIEEMESYNTKSIIDIWNRVDNGFATPDQQLKVLRENFENDFERFDIALWESQGKPLENYLIEVEKLDPNTNEFVQRYTDLALNVTSKNDYQEGLGRLKSDNAKISLGRIVGRGFGIQETPYLGDIVSGTVDALHVIIMDPLNLVGPAVKWSRFARFGIRANEIGLAAAADDAIDVARGADGILFTPVKAGETGDTQVVRLLLDDEAKSQFKFSEDILRRSKRFRDELRANGIDDTDLFLIDSEGLPTPFLLDNWESLVQAAKKSSDNLIGEIMYEAGVSPEEVVDMLRKREYMADTRSLNNEMLGVYNELEALDHLQIILRRVGKPTVDIKTGGRFFNWMANSSLSGTRRWMDRVVQAFIDLENNVDNAMSSLVNDLGAGSRIVIPLKAYHDLLKSRGLKGITNRQDLWGWLETSALYHMNIGDFTGQIARGFGSGIPLPKNWRVFGRLTGDTAVLENRAALGMLPRLTKNGIRRRKLWNKTEKAMFALTATKENETLLRKLGMKAPRSVAKFLFSLSHQIPANSFLHLASENTVEEFQKLLNYGFFAGVPREVLDDFLERFIRGESVGTRVVSDLSRTEINERLNYIQTNFNENLAVGISERTAIESIRNHPIIAAIRDELGIKDPFTYRSNSARLQASGLQPGQSNAYEFGWSDEVIERWDEVAEIINSSRVGPDALDAGRRQAVDLANERLSRLTVQDYIEIFTSKTKMKRFVLDLKISVDDIFTDGVDISNYLKNLYDHLRKDSEFVLGVKAREMDEFFDSDMGALLANFDANWDTVYVEDFIGQVGEPFLSFQSQNVTDTLTQIFKSYRKESVFNNTVATRIKVEQQFLHELFNKAGVYTSEAGREWADDFFGHLNRFRYAPNDEDVFALKTLSGELANIRVAVLPLSQRSRVVAIPPFEKFVEKMNQIGIIGRFTRRLNRSFLDAAMTDIWKPLTLMRLGFIPRAAGEEYLAFYARRGIWAPISSIASNIAPDRRGFILGGLNHLGSLPSRFYRRIGNLGWHNDLSQVSDIIKFRNQADYMAYVANKNNTLGSRIFVDSQLGADMFDEMFNPAFPGRLNINNPRFANLPKEAFDKLFTKINVKLANGFDYLRIASEYHTAKVAASIKSFNFKLMPKHLQRAILAEFGGTGKAEFAADLGIIDHYAVTSALQDDADKLLRVAYMQQNFADAQSGVGGMIADSNLMDQTATETIRLKSSAFSKQDDIVVTVRADRGWVSVDPTELENDGIYLAAAQQGSLIDNDPIAMEAVRVLANRVQQRRLALNYQHLTGTQWDAAFMEVPEEFMSFEAAVDALLTLNVNREVVTNFASSLQDDANATFINFFMRFKMQPSDPTLLEQRLVASIYLNGLDPIEVTALYDEMYAVIKEDPDFLRWLDERFYEDHLINRSYMSPEDWSSNSADRINDLQISTGSSVQEFLNSLRGLQNDSRLYDPFNPEFRPERTTLGSEGRDVLDRHADYVKQRLRSQFETGEPDLEQVAIDRLGAADSIISQYVNDPKLADSFASMDTLYQWEEAIKKNDPSYRSQMAWDPFESNPEYMAVEQWDDETLQSIAEEAAVAQEFFDSHLFRITNTPDQYYIDELGNLHLRSNTSGRNQGNVISTFGPRTENFVAERDTVTGFTEFWGGPGRNDAELTQTIAIKRDSVKSISGGAGADNPDNPFEIELLTNSNREVVVPQGSYTIFYNDSPVRVIDEWTAVPRIDVLTSRSNMLSELQRIVDGTLDQNDSLLFKNVGSDMQLFIDEARIRGSIEQLPTREQILKLNTDKTLEQFEVVRQSVAALEPADRRLLEAAFQSDQIAAGKSVRDPLVETFTDTSKLHPVIQHQLDYLPVGAHYGKALKRALELADQGDKTMLELIQVMSAVDRDITQILFNVNPLEFADEAADIVAAEAAVLRALQNPDYQTIVDDFFLANFDEATGLGPVAGLNEFERPVYSVMVDTWTAQWIERLLGPIGHSAEDMRGVDSILNMLRVKGASDDDLEMVQRVLLGFDEKQVSRQVAASNPIYRTTLVPISSTLFTNVQDTQRVVDLLTGLSPAAGEYRRYLGWTARPNTQTFAKVGHARVPAEKGRVLNAVFSDDARTLTFEPNFQYHIDRVSPLAEPENLIYYDENTRAIAPAGEIALEGVTRESILQEAARRIVSTVLGFVQSREGRYLHELIGPMNRGSWGVDAMYHVPVSELPTRIIYRTPYVAPQGNWWQAFVQRNFELINKAIYSISRSPQFMLGLSEGLAFAREITDVWRDPLLDDAFDVIMRSVNDVGDDALTKSLASNSRRELRNAWAMIGEAATSELNDGAELLDELMGLAADGRLHPDSSLLELTAEQADTVLDWIRLDAHLEKLEMQRGFNRAVAETVPYIDDHNVRSFFQVYAKNIFPFEFAQEAFLKRWARTVVYSPEAFRRLQLLVHSLQSSGFAQEDPVSGKLVFVFPWTESLEDLIISNPATQVIFGDAARIPIANPMTGKLENVLPGVPSDFQNLPQVSPIAMLPLTAIAAKFPEFKPLLSQVSGGRPIDTSGVIPTAETILSQWVPANYLRIVSAGLGLAAERLLDVNITNSAAFGFTDTELSQAVMSAMAQLEAEAIRLRSELETVTDEKEIEDLVDKINLMSLPNDATAVQIEQHVDMVFQWARMNMMFRSVIGFASPTAPRNAFEGYELSKEYGELLKVMSPEEALAAFLTEHPDAQPWTIFQTEKTTPAELSPTQRSLDWMNDNREFLDTYEFAAPWFMPQAKNSDESSMQAHIDMVAAGMKKYKLPVDWYKDLKSTSAANIYFPSKARKDAALEATVSAEQRKKIENEWTLWADEFKKQHPIFAEELAGSIDSKAVQTLDQLNDLLLLDNDELPNTEHIEPMRTMVQSWKRYEASMNRIKGLSSKEVRLQRDSLRTGFLMWGEMFTLENPAVRSLWNSLVLPAADLTSEARLLQGKD